MSKRYEDIGGKLRAYRLGKALTADQVAEMLGVSRAVVYRIEAGEIVKIETLDKLAGVLDISVSSLLGVGVEYYANAVSYFERMRQVEEQSEQVIAHFPPLSYLLTSNDYAKSLKKTLLEAQSSNRDDKSQQEAEIDRVIAVLDERKSARRRRHLSVINFVNLPEIERWLKLGVIGNFNLAADELAKRRLAVRHEIEHLIGLIEREPMGVQIGLIEETLPNITFQLFRQSDRTLLGLSPFRLGGELPNIRTGVAMLTGDEEPVRLYEQLVERLWRQAHKGRSAAELLRKIVQRSAIPSPKARRAS